MCFECQIKQRPETKFVKCDQCDESGLIVGVNDEGPHLCSECKTGKPNSQDWEMIMLHDSQDRE